MDVCVVTNDNLLARFIKLELEEAGYSVICSKRAENARLLICDKDFTSDVKECAISFSYDASKQESSSGFLLRPIDAKKLKSMVAALLSTPMHGEKSPIEINSETRIAKGEKGEIRLSEKEFSLLKLLTEVPLLSREEGMQIFDTDEGNVVDVYIHYLRTKLAKICSTQTIKARRGKGYCLSEEASIKFT